MKADLAELERRLSEATGASRELDEAIAEALFGVSVWKSKYGYWNVSFPPDWPFGGNDHNVSMPGREQGYDFDPATGEKLPTEIRPSGWSDNLSVELPQWSASIDAALALVERFYPSAAGHFVELSIGEGGYAEIHSQTVYDALGTSGGTNAASGAIAILLALIRTLGAPHAEQ